MPRYIDAEKLSDFICYLKCKDARAYCGVTNTCWVVKEIRTFPTADVVEVVQCKDCEFYDEDEKWCRRLGLCGAFNGNDFCSHGERRE